MDSLAAIRKRTHEVLEVGANGDQLSRTIDVLIMGLVLGNVVAVILESVPSIGGPYGDLFVAFEQISVVTFSSEFLARIWSVADDAAPGERAFTRRLRYLRSPMAIVDVVAIAPFYLSALFALDLRFLRVLRLMRIVKLTRYSAALGRLFEVYRLQRAALALPALACTRTDRPRRPPRLTPRPVSPQVIDSAVSFENGAATMSATLNA